MASWTGGCVMSSYGVRACFKIVGGRRVRARGLRACLETTRGAVFVEKAGWRGATKENIPGGSSTEEQRSQTAFSPKTLRAAGLLSVAGVDSFLTARCGRCARPKPPWPQPKSLAAAPLVVSKQALSAGGHQISHSERFDNSLSLNDPPNIDPPNIDPSVGPLWPFAFSFIRHSAF